MHCLMQVPSRRDGALRVQRCDGCVVWRSVCCALLVALLCLAVGCDSPDLLVDSDLSLSRVRVAKTLVMGVSDRTPPMCFRYPNGEIVGFDVDLARAVCRVLGVRLIIRPIKWTLKRNALRCGLVDCVWTAFAVTARRRTEFLLSEPYLRTAQVLLVREGRLHPDLAHVERELGQRMTGVSAVHTRGDILPMRSSHRQARIAVLSGGPVPGNEKWQFGFEPHGKVVWYRHRSAMLEALRTRAVDAALVDLVEAHDAVHRQGAPLRVMRVPLGLSQYAVAFRREDRALRDEIQRILYRIAASGEAYRIAEKWFGVGQSVIGIE